MHTSRRLASLAVGTCLASAQAAFAAEPYVVYDDFASATFDPACPSSVAGYCRGPDATTVSRTLTASLVNDTAAAIDGHMDNVVQVYGSSAAVVAVPEPASVAMLFAGLGASGFIQRRRRA